MECHYLISETTYNELIGFKTKYLSLKSKNLDSATTDNDHSEQSNQNKNKLFNQDGGGCNENQNDCECPKPGPSSYTEPQFNKLLKADNSSGLANICSKVTGTKVSGNQFKSTEIELPQGQSDDIFRENILSDIPKRHKSRAIKIVRMISDNCTEKHGFYIINNVKYSQTHLKTLLKSILNNNKTWLQGRENLCQFLKLHGLIMKAKRDRKVKQELTVKPEISKVLNCPPKNWFCLADMIGNVVNGAIQPTSADDVSQPTT